MAELKVEVVEIEEVIPHENADRLELAKVFGYHVVVGLNQYKAGDCAVYFPVDSILPDDLRDCIFNEGKMNPVSRIRAARIRGAVSQGLLVSCELLAEYKPAIQSMGMYTPGTDLTKVLGVTKHDPEEGKPPTLRGNPTSKNESHPLFHKYTSIQHAKRYGDKAFGEGDMVIITEKIHGTNFRAGWVPIIYTNSIDKTRASWYDKYTESKWYKQPIKWLKYKLSLPRHKFVWGSHNVQLKPSEESYHMDSSNDGPKGRGPRMNVYEQCVIANSLWERIPYGQIWYGEIYGPGIQKGYGYGLKDGEFDVRFFDIRDAYSGDFFDFDYAKIIFGNAGVKVVPHWTSTYDVKNIDYVLNKGRGGMKSAIDPTTDIEGLVIRSPEEDTYLGNSRCILKWISNAFLLRKGMTEYK